jgi:hypothetical protein
MNRVGVMALMMFAPLVTQAYEFSTHAFITDRA